MPPKDNISIFDNIKGAANSTLNVDDIKNSPSYQLSPTEQNMFNQQQEKYNPATGALNPTDYYPTLNSPINVGSYSGSIIGSTSLFAPEGALVPIGMMDARDAAIQKAALQKAKDVQDFQDKLKANAPKTNLPGIREDLTNSYFRHLENSWQKALKDNDGDPNKATHALQNNIDFKRKTQSFHDFGQRGSDVVTKLADIQDRMAKGEVVSPELQQYMEKVQESMNPDSPEFKNLSENIFKMYSEQELGSSINKIAKQIVMQQDAAAGIDVNDPEYIKEHESTTKYFRPEHKEYLKEALRAIYPNSRLYSPERLDKAAEDFTSGVVRTSKVGASQKRAPGAGEVEDLNVEDISKEPVSLLGAVSVGEYEDKPGGKYTGSAGKREGNFSALDHMTFKKPVSVVIPAGANITNPETGEKSTAKNVRNAVIGSVFNTYVTPNGQMVDDEIVKDPKLKKALKVVPMVSVMFKDKDADGNEIETSGMVPMKDVENALKGKRGQNTKVIDEYKTRAKSHESKIRGGGEATTTEMGSKKSEDKMITVTLNGKSGQIPEKNWEAFKKKHPTATR
jgi:hypothetical protein